MAVSHSPIESPSASPEIPRPRRTRFLWLGIALLLPLAAALVVPRLWPEPLPPRLATLPEFTLVDANGAPFGSAELRGRNWVASFFFTRCVTICPRLRSSMQRLADRLERAGLDDVHLVSITVDPGHDTPEQLAEYAAKHGIDATRWSLLTGADGDVRSLVREGFRLALGPPEQRVQGFLDIAHSARLVLVDREGQVRGYFTADSAGLDALFSSCRRLERASSNRLLN